ncbi:MAG: TolC family protein [Bdellovibrionales bacterium]|nr:TolC family protein [Bdellovibrionales bacterium]
MKRILISALLIPLSASAETLELRDAISRALERNGELRAQKKTELQAEADRDRAAGEFGWKLTGLAAVAPITKAEGNATFAQENKSTIGRTYIGKFEFLQPLYTFGRKQDYVAAAERGILVKAGDTLLREAEVRYQVKEAFWGYQAAASFLDQISDGRKDVDKIREDRGMKRSQQDGYRLDILAEQLRAKEAEARKLLTLARGGFSLRIGAGDDAAVPKNDWISAAPRELKPLDHYLRLARENRAEFRQIELGIEAKHLLARAEKKSLLPVVALGAQYEFADTNVRTAQPGPFAWDPYNREALSVGLGLKVDFQWDLAQAKSARYRAEAEELEAKLPWAQEGLLLEVKRAYWDVEAATARLEAATNAYKTGKKWINREMAAFSAGLGRSERLVQAWGARAETVKEYLEAIYGHHMAWAAMSRAVGREVDPLLL